MSLKRNWLMGHPYQDGKLDHKEDYIWVDCLIVVFGDWFLTVTIQMHDLPNFNADEWAKMFGTSTYCIPALADGE